MVSRVGEITGGHGADLILDPIGGKGFGRNFAMLAPLGMVISYGRLEGPPDPDFLSAMRAHSGKSPAVHFVLEALSPSAKHVKLGIVSSRS